MLNRRLLPLVAALVAAGVGTTACAEQSAALRVGDQSVSQAELFEELEFITTNDEFREFQMEGVPLSEIQGTLRASYTQPFVSAILGRRLNFLLAGEVLDANDLEVTDDDRDGVEQELGQIPGGEAMPDRYREDLIEGFARFQVLEQAIGDAEEIEAQFDQAARSTAIEVNPRFGSWNADDLQLEPPPGPTGESGEDGAGTGSG